MLQFINGVVDMFFVGRLGPAAQAAVGMGGQVVMIDFQKRDLPVGPPMDMKIAREDLLKQMQANGFQLAAEHTFLPYQYFLVFTVK